MGTAGFLHVHTNKTGGANLMQARASVIGVRRSLPDCSPRTFHCHRDAYTNTPGTQSRALGAGRGAGGARVHRLPRRDHRRSPRELRRPAINALCFNDALSHKIAHVRNGRITCCKWSWKGA